MRSTLMSESAAVDRIPVPVDVPFSPALTNLIKRGPSVLIFLQFFLLSSSKPAASSARIWSCLHLNLPSAGLDWQDDSTCSKLAGLIHSFIIFSCIRWLNWAMCVGICYFQFPFNEELSQISIPLNIHYEYEYKQAFGIYENYIGGGCCCCYMTP